MLLSARFTSEWDVPCISFHEVIQVKRTERFLHRWNLKGSPHSRSFLLLSAAFVLGAGLGMLCAWLVGAEGCGNLKLFFSLYSQIAPDSTCTWSNFLHTLWYFLRLPLLLFLVGFSALGVFVIPAVMLCKGFSFAFAISTLVLLYGPSGLLASSMLHTATKNRMGMKNSSANPKNTAAASRPEGP